MKKIILVLLCQGSLDSFCQCANNAIVVSISPGYAKTGVLLGMEAGLWPVAGKIGVMAGPIMYNQVKTDKGKTETIAQLDLTARVLYKITELGNNSPQLFTLYGSVTGMIGISYRSYVSLSEFELLGVEPFYSKRTGAGINLFYTIKL
jgi:hypothetical protein